MVVFTMIMGNAFAAFTVITLGVGVPFVIANGGNLAIIGALGMTCGYCGTLLTPGPYTKLTRPTKREVESLGGID